MQTAACLSVLIKRFHFQFHQFVLVQLCVLWSLVLYVILWFGMAAWLLGWLVGLLVGSWSIAAALPCILHVGLEGSV